MRQNINITYETLKHFWRQLSILLGPKKITADENYSVNLNHGEKSYWTAIYLIIRNCWSDN